MVTRARDRRPPGWSRTRRYLSTLALWLFGVASWAVLGYAAVAMMAGCAQEPSETAADKMAAVVGHRWIDLDADSMKVSVVSIDTVEHGSFAWVRVTRFNELASFRPNFTTGTVEVTRDTFTDFRMRRIR